MRFACPSCAATFQTATAEGAAPAIACPACGAAMGAQPEPSIALLELRPDRLPTRRYDLDDLRARLELEREVSSLPRPAPRSGEQVWFAGVHGRQVGPLTLAGLQGLRARGQLTAASLVWRDGFPAWVCAEAVPELRGLLGLPEEKPGSPFLPRAAVEQRTPPSPVALPSAPFAAPAESQPVQLAPRPSEMPPAAPSPAAPSPAAPSPPEPPDAPAEPDRLEQLAVAPQPPPLPPSLPFEPPHDDGPGLAAKTGSAVVERLARAPAPRPRRSRGAAAQQQWFESAESPPEGRARAVSLALALLLALLGLGLLLRGAHGPAAPAPLHDLHDR